MKTIETVGKDIEQALLAGLTELGCKLDDVDVKILEHPGIFRKARVRMTYHGDDATVEKKTAASVMRNLEERAARVAASGQGSTERQQPRSDKNRRNERRERPDNRDERPGQNRNFGQQSPHERQNGERPDNNPVQPQIRTRENAFETRGDKKPPETERSPKSEFKRDFRAELAAANNGNAEQPRRGERNNNNEQPRRKPEPAREAVSPETLAAAKDKIAAYLQELTALMGMPSEVVTEIKDGGVDAALTAEDENLVGSRGETLEALEHLATLAANGGDNRQVRVNLDCGGYRKRLADDLAKSAVEAADKVAATGKRIELPPMSSSGRRVVHAALGEREDVITRSEGREPNRYIVIIPRRAGERTNGAAGNVGNRRPGGGYNNKNRNNNNKHWNNHGRRAPGGKDSGAE